MKPSIRSAASGRGDGSSRRHQPDELRPDDLDPPHGRFGLDAGDDLVQRRGFVVLHVHAHLHEPGTRQVESECTNAREASVTLPDDPGDLAGRLDLAPQVDVERDQRPARTDDHPARPLVEPRGAEVRLKLSCVDPALQLSRPAATEERGPTARSKIGVQEHREGELLSHAPCKLERRRACIVGGIRPDRDHRDDIRRTDPGMRTLVLPQVDPLARDPDAGQECAYE